MSYVKHILMPGEQVLYDGHVHPKVMVPGAILLGIAALILIESSHTGGSRSWLLLGAYHLGRSVPALGGIYRNLLHWQQISPNILLEIKILALGIALFGFSRLMQGLVLMQSTELIVTDKRVIAKAGLMTVVTVEMDRRRIAGVTVDQPFLGRIMGYGYIYIQGFTSSIGGLPPMVKPHMVERFLNI